MKVWQADAAIFVAACLWGLSFVFTFWGLQDCSPAIFLLCRFGLALAAALILFGRHLKGGEARHYRRGLILGGLLGGAHLLQVYSVNFTEVSRAAFIAAMTLPAIPLVAWIISREPVKRHNALGIALALVGLYFFLDPQFTELRAGDFIAMCSVPLWALYMIYMNKFTEGQDGFPFTARMLILQLAGGLPILVLAVLVFESGWILAPLHESMGQGLTLSPRFIYSLLFCALLASLAIAFIQTMCQKYTSAVQAMLIFQFEPIIATAAAWLWIPGTVVSAANVVGAAVIIAGVLTSELGGRRAAEEPAAP